MYADYAEKTLDYVEILTVKKTDDKAYPMYRITIRRKVLQSLTV